MPSFEGNSSKQQRSSFCLLFLRQKMALRPSRGNAPRPHCHGPRCRRYLRSIEKGSGRLKSRLLLSLPHPFPSNAPVIRPRIKRSVSNCTELTLSFPGFPILLFFFYLLSVLPVHRASLGLHPLQKLIYTVCTSSSQAEEKGCVLNS